MGFGGVSLRITVFPILFDGKGTVVGVVVGIVVGVVVGVIVDVVVGVSVAADCVIVVVAGSGVAVGGRMSVESRIASVVVDVVGVVEMLATNDSSGEIKGTKLPESV